MPLQVKTLMPHHLAGEWRPKIDPELQRYLPVRSAADLIGLEKSIVESKGNRDPIVIWAEENIIADGHERFAICERHGLPIRVEYREFPTREAVLEWMVNEQLNRRNLSDRDRDYFIGLRYDMERAKHGGKRDGESRGSTAERIAEEQQVSASTVRQAAEFTKAVDSIAAVEGEEAKRKILAGEGGSKAAVIANAPVLCDRCRRVGIVDGCSTCEEERLRDKEKKEAREQRRKAAAEAAKVPEPTPAEQVSNVDTCPPTPKDDGTEATADPEPFDRAAANKADEEPHLFAELKAKWTAALTALTKAVNGDGEHCFRLYEYMTACSLLDHPPNKLVAGKENKPQGARAIFGAGISRLIHLAGLVGEKQLTIAKIKHIFAEANGSRPFIPPIHAKAKAKKAGG